MMKSLIPLCAATLLSLAFEGSAGPLRRGDVPAEPVWLLHLDCDGMRPTALGRFIQSEMEKPEAQAKLAAFQALFSFDLRTQLHGLTLYGSTTAPQDGILLVYADFDPDRLVTLAKAANDAKQTAYKQSTIYSWIDDHKKQRSTGKGRTYAAIEGKCVIFGQREQRVAQALDVISGANANLASSQLFPELGIAGSTSFIEAAARKLELDSSDPNAAILRLSKLMRFQLAESQQQVKATLTLEANDDEVAGNMSSIAQGLISLMKLQKDKPDNVKLAEAMTLKQQGNRLVLHLNMPANEFVDLVKADAARKAQRKAAAKQAQAEQQ